MSQVVTTEREHSGIRKTTPSTKLTTTTLEKIRSRSWSRGATVLEHLSVFDDWFARKHVMVVWRKSRIGNEKRGRDITWPTANQGS